MNQPVPTTKPKQSTGVWLIILALVLVSVPLLLLLALIGVYFSSRSANVELRDRTQVAERLAAELQAHQAATPSATLMMAPSAPPLPERANPQTIPIKVEFEDFDSRTGEALAIDFSTGLSYLTAPSLLFAPATGKLNGRMVTQQPALIRLTDWFSQEPSSGGGMAMAGGLPGMMGPPSFSSDRSVVMVAPLPGLGLTLVRTQTRLAPLRIKGDFPEVAVGEELSVDWRSPSGFAPPDLTVLGTDQSITGANGQHLVHMLKLPALQGGVGALVHNSTGQPVGQIVVTQPDQSGSTFTYAAPLGRIFDVYYEQLTAPKSDKAGTGADTDAPVIPPAIAPTGLPAAISPNGQIPGDNAPPRSQLPEAVDTLPGREAQSFEKNLTSPRADSGPEADPFAAQSKDGKAANPGNGAKSTGGVPSADIFLERPDSAPRGREPLRSRSLDVAGRNPHTIAQRLTRLFGQEATFAVDEATGRVFVNVIQPVTTEKAQQLLAEINSTTADLLSPALVGAESVTMRGTGPGGLVGQITLDPAQQETRGSSRRDDTTLDEQARQLAQKYLSANPADQPALRKELTDLTERHFNLRQAERKREIDEIGRRLEKLRASHQQRQQRKSEVIERRLQDLLDTNSDFWTGESRKSKKPPATGQAALGAGDWPQPAAASLPNPNRASENPPAGQDSTTIPGTPTSAEKTFDGVTYGQWLKLLQTERKPDLIAAAIDASSRLAEPQDQARITHQIFIAAQFLEFANESERLLVWETSWKGLGRLRPEIVAAELLAVVHNPETAQSGRQFVGQCLANHSTKPLQEELFKQAPKLIDELLALHQRGGDAVDWLLAGASAVWRDSGRPISDFAELQPRLLKFIENGFAMGVSGPADTVRPEWLIVAGALITRNPEAPDLAMKLYDHAEKSREVLALIGELGRHAEPVVPLLVDDFVANWNVYERESRLTEQNGPPTRAATAPPVPSQRCRDLIAVLGKIGVGEKGGLLLRDLRLILPSSRTRFESPASMRLAPLAASVAAAVPQWTLPSNDASPLILNDHTMITGTWRLSDGLPSPSNLLLQFGQLTVQAPRSAGSALFLTEGGQKLGDRFEINPSAAVKQISFFEVTGPRGTTLHPAENSQKELSGTRRDGIYELTGTKLRFQLAGLAQPRPTAFAKDRTELAEGELLLEFQREIPDWTTFTQIPR